MRGRARLVECYYCGRKVPVDKAIRTMIRGFNYFDERVGLKHRGAGMTVYVCPSCARHRGIKDLRPKRGRPKKR